MFREEKKSLAGWGNYPWVECATLEPQSTAEWQQLIGSSSALIPRGVGRSYGDQALLSAAEGRVGMVTGLRRLLSFDEKKGIAVAESGVTLDEIGRIFAPHGWFLAVTPGTRFVTLGGAIANDVHGKAHHVDGSFIETVESFTILTGKGELLNCSRRENSDLFRATFGGLGLTGVVQRVTLRLRRITSCYFRQRAIRVRSLHELLESLDEADESYSYSVAWVDPLARGKRLGSGVLTVGNSADVDELPESLRHDPLAVAGEPKLSVPLYLPGFALNGASVRLLNLALGYLQSSAGEFSHYSRFFYPLDSIGNWNRGYGRRGFVQYQFVVPFVGARDVIAEILSRIARSGATPFLNVLKRFGDKPGGLLSFPQPGYTFAIDFPVTRPLFVLAKQMDAIVLEAGGRIYLGKDALLDRDSCHRMYPEVAKFLKIKKKYDPENRFRSHLSARLGLDLT